VQNPGLPPHRERITDKDPAAMKRAVRTVYTLFYLSLAGSIWAVAAYMLFPIESGQIVDIRHNNLFIGLGIALALLAIGIGAIHWSKAVMSDKEHIEPRHATRGRDVTREGAVAVFRDANEESGFGRRTAIRGSLIAALVASILPGITLFRGLAPESSPENPIAGDPVALLSHTMWKKGERLAHDPTGEPIRAADLTLGSAVHVIPESLASSATATATSRRRRRRSSCSCACCPSSSSSRRPQELVVQRHRRVLEGLHARRMPRRAVRAADPPPALPLPPVAVRRDPRRRGHLRPGRASAAAAADHRRLRGLPRRAERLHRTRRPELLGAPLSTATVTETGPDTTPQTSRDEKPLGGRFVAGAANYIDERTSISGWSRSSVARSSPTTGPSCSARSRCGASSSSCCRARS
jgi:hypothetical protein